MATDWLAISGNRKSVLHTFVLVLFVLLALFQSPLSPFGSGYPGTDSSVFLFTAQEMLDGNALYTEIWDHKGPYVYYFNAVGMLLGGFFGVWLLEVFFLIVAAYYGYKTAMLFAQPSVALLTAVILVLASITYLNGGNFTEEWSLPFLFVSFYLVVCYLKSGKASFIETFFVGLSFGVTFLLRPNNAGAFIIVGLIVTYKEIRSGSFRQFGNISAGFVSGLMLSFLPLIIQFGLTNSWKAFYSAVIGFNMGYIDVRAVERIRGMFRVLQDANTAGLVSISFFGFVLAFFLYGKKKNARIDHEIWLLYVGAFAVTVFMNGLSGKDPTHYSLIFLPLLVYPLVTILSLCTSCANMHGVNVAVLSVALIPALFVFELPSMFREYRRDRLEERMRAEVIDYVIDNTLISDPISVVGNASDIYLLSGRPTASKYHFVPQLFYEKSAVSKSMVADYIGELSASPPLLFIIPALETMDLIEHPLIGRVSGIQHEYMLAFENSDFTVFARREEF